MLIVKAEDFTLIQAMEEKTLRLYQESLDSRVKKLEKYGVKCLLGLSWKTGNTIIDDQRPKIGEGYCAFITISVRNASGEIVESDDHDVCMDCAYFVSQYCKGSIQVYNAVDEEAYEALDGFIEYFEQTDEKAHEKPDRENTASGRHGGLWLHKFLVYFGLWALAVLCLVQGVRMLGTESFPESLKNHLNSVVYSRYFICIEDNDFEPLSLRALYYVFPGMKTVSIAAGICMTALGAAFAFACIRLVQFRKNAPALLIRLFGIGLLMPVIYCGLASLVMGIPFFRLFGSSFRYECLILISVPGIIAFYYSTKKALFHR